MALILCAGDADTLREARRAGHTGVAGFGPRMVYAPARVGWTVLREKPPYRLARR
jgi:hypothetical protein